MYVILQIGYNSNIADNLARGFLFMTSLKERVAYLQGLTQGLNVNSQSSEGKLLLNIIEVLDDVAEEIKRFKYSKIWKTM